MSEEHETMGSSEVIEYIRRSWTDRVGSLPPLALDPDRDQVEGQQLEAVEARLGEIMAVDLPGGLSNPCEGITGNVARSRAWLQDLLLLRRETEQLWLQVLQHWRARRLALNCIEGRVAAASNDEAWNEAGEQVEAHIEPLRDAVLRWDVLHDRAQATMAWVARLEAVSDLMMTPPPRWP